MQKARDAGRQELGSGEPTLKQVCAVEALISSEIANHNTIRLGHSLKCVASSWCFVVCKLNSFLQVFMVCGMGHINCGALYMAVILCLQGGTCKQKGTS